MVKTNSDFMKVVYLYILFRPSQFIAKKLKVHTNMLTCRMVNLRMKSHRSMTELVMIYLDRFVLTVQTMCSFNSQDCCKIWNTSKLCAYT